MDYHLVMDLIPAVARIFFLKQLGDVSLSAAQCVSLPATPDSRHVTVSSVSQQRRDKSVTMSSRTCDRFKGHQGKKCLFFFPVAVKQREVETAVTIRHHTLPCARVYRCSSRAKVNVGEGKTQ